MEVVVRVVRNSLTLLVTISLFGCLFVKAPETKVDVQNVDLSPLPEVTMGEEMVRTRSGDMIAMLPQGWVFLDSRSKSSADVVAVAVDPEYKISAVFSLISGSDVVPDSVERDGLLGLARRAYAKHVRKTGGAVQLSGTYSSVHVGTKHFGLYEFTSSGGALRTRCAVYTSSVGNNYQFSLVPLNVSGRENAPDAEIQRIFRSILTTIQY